MGFLKKALRAPNSSVGNEEAILADLEISNEAMQDELGEQEVQENQPAAVLQLAGAAVPEAPPAGPEEEEELPSLAEQFRELASPMGHVPISDPVLVAIRERRKGLLDLVGNIDPPDVDWDAIEHHAGKVHDSVLESREWDTEEGHRSGVGKLKKKAGKALFDRDAKKHYKAVSKSLAPAVKVLQQHLEAPWIQGEIDGLSGDFDGQAARCGVDDYRGVRNSLVQKVRVAALSSLKGVHPVADRAVDALYKKYTAAKVEKPPKVKKAKQGAAAYGGQRTRVNPNADRIKA